MTSRANLFSPCRSMLAAAVASFALAACGSSVTITPGAGGVGTTTTGAGATGGTAGSGAGTTTTGAGATGGMGGTGGGTIECGRTNDSAQLSLETWDGQQWGCNVGPGMQTGLLVLEAEVVDVAPGSIILDSCPPNAYCAPELNTLAVDAPGLNVALPVGMFVEVRMAVEQPWGCWHQLSIRNLPEWGGEPNPFGGGRRLWLAVSDGLASSTPGAPFEVSPLPLGCYPPDEPSCGALVDDFALTFRTELDPTSVVTVGMGQTVTWELLGPAGPIYWDVRNLRSFESGACDDHWNWAYWVYPPPPPNTP